MANDQHKHTFSAFIKDQADIIALVLITVLAAAGLLLRQNYLMLSSMLIALLNFTLIYFGSRREKKDERTQHHRNLAAYHTLIATFLLVAIMSSLHRYSIIQNIDVELFAKIVTGSLGFMYAVAYSIIKRLQ